MKLYQINSLLLGVLLLFSFTHIGTRKLMADKANSSVTYAMTHPMHDWDGVSKDVNCVAVYNDDTKQIEQVAVAIPLASFDSGNSNRDSHALEILEGLKFPKVTFVSTKITQATNQLTVDGNLNFHGITKPISLKAVRSESNNKMTIEGGFDVLLSTYKVEQPSLMGIKTDDKFKLKFKVVFALK
jgi:polyisoprenoid-binding protein YceI